MRQAPLAVFFATDATPERCHLAFRLFRALTNCVRLLSAVVEDSALTHCHPDAAVASKVRGSLRCLKLDKGTIWSRV